MFGAVIDGRKEHAIVDIRRIKPAKIVSNEDFWVKDTILNWRLTFKDLFRLIQKGIYLAAVLGHSLAAQCIVHKHFCSTYSTRSQQRTAALSHATLRCNTAILSLHSGVFEIILYTSVQIEKRIQLMSLNEQNEISDADLATLMEWTTDIVRIPET